MYFRYAEIADGYSGLLKTSNVHDIQGVEKMKC